jgi:hypothetical protein
MTLGISNLRSQMDQMQNAEWASSPLILSSGGGEGIGKGSRMRKEMQ